MIRIMMILTVIYVSCAGQPSQIPLTWEYGASENVMFYIYQYSDSDTVTIDSSKIVLLDSLESSGAAQYEKLVSLTLRRKTCFLARAAKKEGQAKIYSEYSGRTHFVEQADTPQKLKKK
jgi:hypothetical protein